MEGRRPIYQAVYDTLKRDILSGQYKVGEKLPSESEMIDMFNVSRTTVRKAVSILADDGFVSIRQGRGTIVIDYTIKQNYNRMNSFTETLRSMGYHVAVKNLSISRVRAQGDVAKALGIEPGSELVCIQRIPLADGRPAAIITNYIPAEYVSNIQQHEKEIVSLYRFLENRYNLVIDMAHDIITARAATFEQACALDCMVGAPMLYTRRICYSNGRPVSYDLVYALAEISGKGEHEKSIAYEIGITLTGKPQFAMEE